jgi:hypothetical protein
MLASSAQTLFAIAFTSCLVSICSPMPIQTTPNWSDFNDVTFKHEILFFFKKHSRCAIGNNVGFMGRAMRDYCVLTLICIV